jgi:hypothetical protein
MGCEGRCSSPGRTRRQAVERGRRWHTGLRRRRQAGAAEGRTSTRPRSTLARTDSDTSTNNNSLGGGGGLNTGFVGTDNISMDGSAVLGADDGRGSCGSILGGSSRVLDRGNAQGGGVTSVGAGDDGGGLPAGGSNGTRGADGGDSVVGLNGGFPGAHSGRPSGKLVGGLMGSLSGSVPAARVRGAVLGTGGRAMARGFDALGVGILGGMGDG